MSLTVRRRGLMGKGDADMPKLIASATLAEDARRIDVAIPDEFQSYDVLKAVVKTKGAGSKATYPCPEINLGSATNYTGEHINGRDYVDTVYVVKSVNRIALVIPVSATATTRVVAESITHIGMMQYYDTNTFLAGSTIEVYAIKTEV